MILHYINMNNKLIYMYIEPKLDKLKKDNLYQHLNILIITVFKFFNIIL